MYCAQDMSGFSYQIKLYLVLSVCSGFFGSIKNMCFRVVGRKISVSLRSLLFRNIIVQDIAFFDGMSTGELTSRMTNDVNGMVCFFKFVPWVVCVTTSQIFFERNCMCDVMIGFSIAQFIAINSVELHLLNRWINYVFCDFLAFIYACIHYCCACDFLDGTICKMESTSQSTNMGCFWWCKYCCSTGMIGIA